MSRGKKRRNIIKHVQNVLTSNWPLAVNVFVYINMDFVS